MDADEKAAWKIAENSFGFTDGRYDIGITGK